jgi:hypothetical protein
MVGFNMRNNTICLYIILSIIIAFAFNCTFDTENNQNKILVIDTSSEKIISVSIEEADDSVFLVPIEFAISVGEKMFFVYNQGPVQPQLLDIIKNRLEDQDAYTQLEVYERYSLSVIKVQNISEEKVEEVLKKVCDEYVGVYFFGGSAYSFAW